MRRQFWDRLYKWKPAKRGRRNAENNKNGSKGRTNEGKDSKDTENWSLIIRNGNGTPVKMSLLVVPFILLRNLISVGTMLLLL
jgi:hypothetical protein